MDNKKAVLKLTFQKICELFNDAKKIEEIVDSITTDEDLEKISLAGSIIIKSLTTNLDDINDGLNDVFTKRMQRKRAKLLKNAERKLKKGKRDALEGDVGSSSDDRKNRRVKKAKSAKKSSDYNENECSNEEADKLVGKNDKNDASPRDENPDQLLPTPQECVSNKKVDILDDLKKNNNENAQQIASEANLSYDSEATILNSDTECDAMDKPDEESSKLIKRNDKIVEKGDEDSQNNKNLANITTQDEDNLPAIVNSVNDTKNNSEFPISPEKLDNIIATFLSSQTNDSRETTAPKDVAENAPDNVEKEENPILLLSQEKENCLEASVVLVENDVSLVAVEDELNISELPKNAEDLVGKIKLVDIGKLTNPVENKSDVVVIEQEVRKIRVAEFAKIQNPINLERINSNEKLNEIEENSKKHRKKRCGNASSDKHDKENGSESIEKTTKSMAEKLKKKLLKFKDERKRRVKEKERNYAEKNTDSDSEKPRQFVEKKSPIKNEQRSSDEEEDNKQPRKNKTIDSDFEDSNTKTLLKESNKSSVPKPKRKNKSKRKERFVIPNNVPIKVEAISTDDTKPTEYAVVNADDLADKKFLRRCYVQMLTRCTPQELLREYEERRLEAATLDEDGPRGYDSSDTMVSGAGGSSRSRALRHHNSKPNSSGSSRNSSRSQRSTRNTNPIRDVDCLSSSSSTDEENDTGGSSEGEVKSSKVKTVQENVKGKRRRGRPRKDENPKNGKEQVEVKAEKKRGDSSAAEDEDSEEDAMSHVSISSTSDPENKKSTRKKNVVKIERDSKAKSRNSDDLDDESDDSLPLTKLPDIKLKKEAVLNDSDDFEPAKKKDKKNSKKYSDSDDDSDHSSSAKKKTANKKGSKKKRVVSDSGSDYEKEANDNDEIESIKSSASEEKEKASTKKQTRKRIKRVDDDSSDNSGDGKPKKGKKKKGEQVDTRKHIRSIMHKGALNQSTIDAEQEEQDRKKRIVDKQKKYNDIYNTSDLESTKLDKVILDIDDDTNEEILSVDKCIVKHLKPHQANGIQFMWSACYESVSMVDDKGSGCILAHCMGLGKTLQVIALIHTLITNSDTTKTEKALVVCPLSTVLNWVSEFRKWLKDDLEFEVYDLVSCKQVAERQHKVADWHKHGGVMIMGYDMFRNISNPDNKRVSKKARSIFVTGLVDPGPDLVICDEGHLLKNEKTSISIAMNRIRTLRRIVLTGTPLQNNLKEYFCMVQFVKPNLLGTYKEYLNRFVNPITNGQYTDSTPHDIQIMRRRSHVLHKLLDGIVQRRDYAVLAPYLPPKHEYVIFVTLTDTQIALYDHYLRVIAPQQRTAASKGVSLFKDFQEFQRICTHPRVLLDKSVQDQMAKWKEDDEHDTDGSEGSLKDFIDDDDDDEESTSSGSDKSSGSEKSKGGPRRGRSKPKPQNVRTTRALAAEKGIDVVAGTSSLEVANTGSEWWREFTTDENLNDILSSTKLSLLFEILHQCEIIGDKVLIFSQSLYSLSIIEYFLSKIDDASQNKISNAMGGYCGSWSLGLDYFRLDGTSSCDNRAAWCKTFNNPKNVRARLFLISTRAGGLGINLVAANRVIIFDVSWNPSHDIQSIYRVYRFGQVKPSFIYRFVTNGAMEMKVYERQVTKQAISKRVIDEQQIDRHYNQNDLAELYRFEPKPEHRPIPPVPKDVLLGELVQDKPEFIFKYHEHHTLLENKQEEELNEEERKAAWEEFENEKKMRQMPPHINNIPIHSIMLGLSNYLKREHPDWSAAEVQTSVPGLVQEMQEKMALGDVTLYNSMIIELRNLQQQQQQQQQQRMQDYYRLQQQNQERLLLERHRQLMQNNATVSYLQRLYANATANNLNPATLNALSALNIPLNNSQLNANPPVIETVDIND